MQLNYFHIGSIFVNEWHVGLGKAHCDIEQQSAPYHGNMGMQNTIGHISTRTADWKTYRADVRTESNSKVTAIAALADMDAIKAFDEATPIGAGWPNDPDS